MKIFLQTGLILAATLCGLGRIRENKHHTSDVIAGFLLGTIVALFVVSLSLILLLVACCILIDKITN
jgi:membrane-associated phospholipid phosphatase